VVPARGDARDGVLGSTDAAWDIALAVQVPSPAGHRAIGEQRDGVQVACGDAGDGVFGSADPARNIALAVVVVSPAGERSVREHRHGVEVTSGDAGDRALGGSDSGGDIALAVVVVSPTGNRAVCEYRDGVVATCGDDRGGVFGVEIYCWCVHFTQSIYLLLMFIHCRFLLIQRIYKAPSYSNAPLLLVDIHLIPTIR